MNIYVIGYVNDNNINRGKKHRSGNQAHAERLQDLLSNGTAWGFHRHSFKYRNPKNGKRRLEKPLTTKNNNEIKQRKIRLKNIRLEVFCGDNTYWSLSYTTRSRGTRSSKELTLGCLWYALHKKRSYSIRWY